MREFDALPLVRADVERFETRCVRGRPSTRAALNAFRQMYKQPARHLVVDASANSQGANGLGNLFGDFVVWIALAAISRRALYVDWARGADAPYHRYDLLRFFTGAGTEDTDADGWQHGGSSNTTSEGLDWAWNPANHERLSRIAPLAPAFAWDARIPCNASAMLLWSLLSSDAASVRIDIPKDQGTAMLPLCQKPPLSPTVDPVKASRTAYSAMRDAISAAVRRNRPTVDETMKKFARLLSEVAIAGPMELASWGMALSTVWALSIDTTSRASEAELSHLVADMLMGEQHRNYTNSVRDRDGQKRLRAATDWLGTRPRSRPIFLLSASQHNEMSHVVGCLLHVLMRPRRELQRALLPLLRKASNATMLFTMQVRSGWADDANWLPRDLEGRGNDAMSLESVAVQRFSRALTAPPPECIMCAELPPTRLKALDACGEACFAKVQPLPGDLSFTAALRQLLASPQAESYPHPSAALTNASARLELLSWDFAHPVPRQELKLLEEKLTNLCGPPTPGAPSLLHQPRENADSRVLLPTPIARAAHCLSRLARRRSGVEEWVVALSSDAPGIRELFSHWPGFDGRTLPCAYCNKPTAHSQTTPSKSIMALGLSVELWLHGASVALLPVAQTTLTTYAIRSQNVLTWPRASTSKRIDLCVYLPARNFRGVDRGERNMPTGSCLALKWLGFGWLGARALSHDATRVSIERAVVSFRQRLDRADTTAVANCCLQWSIANCSRGEGCREHSDAQAIAPRRYNLPMVTGVPLKPVD